jgi:hypothetical protein
MRCTIFFTCGSRDQAQNSRTTNRVHGSAEEKSGDYHRGRDLWNVTLLDAMCSVYGLSVVACSGGVAIDQVIALTKHSTSTHSQPIVAAAIAVK